MEKLFLGAKEALIKAIFIMRIVAMSYCSAHQNLAPTLIKLF
jgi:hypothetical protein